MSNAESTSDGRTPVRELADKLMDQAPALGLPRLVAVDHLAQSLNDARRRVRDTHAMQMKALGHDVNEGTGDDVGISVAGDTHINITSPPAKEGGAMLRKVLPTVAALLAGSALPVAGFLLSRYLDGKNAPAPDAPSAPADSAYEVLFYDADGKPIKVQHISERQGAE